MCGRFALSCIPLAIAEAFGIRTPAVKPRYNIAPTQPAAVLLREPEGNRQEFQALTWGLIPFWSKTAGGTLHPFNARSETAHEKPAFRAAFRHRRCLVPADGFYEWKREGRARKPYYFTASEKGVPMALAGIWEDWEKGGDVRRTFAVLTTAANGTMRPVHDRMPVIIPPDRYADWLNPALQRRDELADLLVPAPDDWLQKRSVGDYVNTVGHEGPECIAES